MMNQSKHLHLSVYISALLALLSSISYCQSVLSESAQLTLLEEAENYYYSEARRNETAISKFQHVLNKVDLAEEIRLEITFKIANMHLFDMVPELKDKQDFSKALETYDSITAEFPEQNVIVFNSHGYTADCYFFWIKSPKRKRSIYMYESLRELYPKRIALSTNIIFQLGKRAL